MNKVLIALSLSLTLLIPTTNVFARDGEAGSGKTTDIRNQEAENTTENQQEIENLRDQIRDRAQERSARLASKSAQIKARLDAVKLQVCKTHQAIIKTRSESLANRADRQFTVFGQIATAVENFYASKVVPKGITVANYDDLVADIATQKASAEEAITAAGDAASAFDCSSDNPKAQLKDFNDKMALARDALKDYRTAIKNLIVSVKSAVGKSKSATSSAE